MLLIGAEQLALQPWRNGGGHTRELLTKPTGADWKLRISLADIEADGSFSSFPRAQRWFAVVQGAGVMLRFSTGARRVLQSDTPLCFDGETAPWCSLIDGPTRDLNLMVREGLGTMKKVEADELWNDRFDERGLFAVSAGLWQQESLGPGGNNPQYPGLRIEANTLLWDIGDGPCRFIPDQKGTCGWWLGYSENGT